MRSVSKRLLQALLLTVASSPCAIQAQGVANCPAVAIADPVVRSSPTIFRFSDTVDLNQTVQLFGDSVNSAKQQVAVMGFAIADAAVNAPQPSPAFNATGGTCLTILEASATAAKVSLPITVSRSGVGPAIGLYALQLGNLSGASTVQFLNRAEPWWVLGSINDKSGTIFPSIQGGTSDQVIPGQSFRVFGRNLLPPVKCKAGFRGMVSLAH